MEDKLTPMEAEVMELTEPSPCSEREAASYGTATPPKPKKNYVGLWITFGLAVIAVCSVSVAAAIRHIRLERTETGSWRLKTLQSEAASPAETVREYTLSEAGANSARSGQLGTDSVSVQVEQSAGTVLTPSELYQNTMESLVSVEIRTMYNTYDCCGVVLTEDGYLVTATSGLDDGISAEVLLNSGVRLTATLIGEDSVSGLSLLKVEADDLKPASFADETELQIGEKIYCIGGLYGSEVKNALSEGILSAAQSVELEGEGYSVLLSSVQPRMSEYGCPILDSCGRIVALTTPIGSWISQSDVTLCFGVGTSSIRTIVSAIVEERRNCPEWLGMRVEKIPTRVSGLYSDHGRIWVSELDESSPLNSAVRLYDVIVSVDGREVNSTNDFYQILNRSGPGDVIHLIIYRSGFLYQISIKLFEE